jgi:hypothetical protein
VARLTYLAPPDVDGALAYQRYYLLGLARRVRLRLAGLPLAARLVPGADARVRAALRLRGGSEHTGYVGRYVAADGTTFAIDARDNHAILDEDRDVFDWSDVYFKANRWPSAEYDAKVLPIVNGNGLLGFRELERLRALRAQRKDVDVVFVSRVWGGREHNVRLFEELARLGVRAELRPILPRGADPAEDAAFTERLRAAGVATSYDAVPRDELWRLLARARVVVFRSGRHLCIPWRMIDLLAMGACILFDAPPLPQWPAPLERGVQYADLGIERPAYGTIDEREYEKVAPAVRELLADERRQAELRAAAARYYDEHAAPERVADYVLDAVASR